jgi:Ca2+-transporting ATPase
MSTEITIDIEPTETYPSSSSNPFAFTPKTLSLLAEPTQKKQSIKLLKSYGGLDCLIKGLHTNQWTGLKDETTSLKPIPLKEITGEDNDDEQNNVQSGSTPIAESSSFYQRKNVFGLNILPEKKLKSILKLMWIAMQEKVLILLIIATIISLGLGLYEDFGSKEVTNQPKIWWVEGVAILIAILIIVLVGSLNDW